MKSSDIHIRVISLEKSQPSITTIHLKIMYLNFHLNFPGVTELKTTCAISGSGNVKRSKHIFIFHKYPQCWWNIVLYWMSFTPKIFYIDNEQLEIKIHFGVNCTSVQELIYFLTQFSTCDCMDMSNLIVITAIHFSCFIAFCKLQFSATTMQENKSLKSVRNSLWNHINANPNKIVCILYQTQGWF